MVRERDVAYLRRDARRIPPEPRLTTAAAFARNLARLAALATKPAQHVEELRALSAAMAAELAGTPVTVQVAGERLHAGDEPLPNSAKGVKPLLKRVAGFGEFALDVPAGIDAGAILSVAMVLGAKAPKGAGTDGLRDALQGRGAGTVLVRAPGSTVPAAATPEPAEARDLAAGDEADPRFVLPVAETAADRLAPSHVDAVLAMLRIADTVPRARRALGELTWIAEQAFREGRAALSLHVTHQIAECEDIVAPDVRRQVVVTLKRLAKPVLLRAMVLRRVEDPASGPAVDCLLERMGVDGAEVVIELFAAARTMAERDEWAALLQALPSAGEAIGTMAVAPYWGTARLAAELAAVLGLDETDRAMADLLAHPDERVRTAAISALARSATPFSADALLRATEDAAPHVRAQAVMALGERRVTRVAPLLARMLDSERAHEVQAAIIQALGRLGTPDAVQRLVALAVGDASPARRQRGVRLAVLLALGEARTPAAMVQVQAMVADQDLQLRSTAARIVREARQRRTQSLAARQEPA